MNIHELRSIEYETPLWVFAVGRCEMSQDRIFLKTQTTKHPELGGQPSSYRVSPNGQKKTLEI